MADSLSAEQAGPFCPHPCPAWRPRRRIHFRCLLGAHRAPRSHAHGRRLRCAGNPRLQELRANEVRGAKVDHLSDRRSEAPKHEIMREIVPETLGVSADRRIAPRAYAVVTNQITQSGTNPRPEEEELPLPAALWRAQRKLEPIVIMRDTAKDVAAAKTGGSANELQSAPNESERLTSSTSTNAVTRQRKNTSPSSQGAGDAAEQICNRCRTASALHLFLKVSSYRGLLVP